jgi:hypothetical protein
MECPDGTIVGSLRLRARELHHLAPLLGFLGDELSEPGRRHRHRHTTQIGNPRLNLRIGQARINLLI